MTLKKYKIGINREVDVQIMNGKKEGIKHFIAGRSRTSISGNHVNLPGPSYSVFTYDDLLACYEHTLNDLATMRAAILYIEENKKKEEKE